MFIKKLELIGFKTFADKTTIEFSDGITAVVGPNGCGKTNVSDALLWVLGESNVRNIRGKQATDVIFNGTQQRRGLGMAEVTLTLDNTCQTLPLSFNEVTITRRAYRNGESEYLINRSKCRLKDIYELFLDTGIGREAYSTVSQGEIDAILSAKPEDRRELLEEAAGIKKYRYRRHEALKKLDKTEANLNRVRDIMAELDGQLEPMNEQAEQAKKYLEIQSQLKNIEIGILIKDIKRFASQLQEIKDSKESSNSKLEAYQNKLAELEERRNNQAQLLDKTNDKFEDARKYEQNAQENLQRLNNKIAVISEKINSTQASVKQSEQEMQNLSAKIEQTNSRLNQAKAEIEKCSDSQYSSNFLVEEQSKLLENLDKQHEQAVHFINDQKANYLEIAKELASKRNALQNAKDRISQVNAGIEKLTRQAQDSEAAFSGSQTKQQEASTKLEAIELEINSLNVEISFLASKRKDFETKINSLRIKTADIARESASKKSRLHALKEMAESHEGFFEGVRNIMSAAKSGKIKGEFAVVADVINVPEGYETAVEIALGGSLQDIIAKSISQAKEGINYLKTNRAGRATFLPLDGINFNRSDIRGSKNSGMLGIASDIISYDTKYDIAIKLLLSRTVIAENIDVAVELSKSLSGWNKIVTLDGELIVPSGAITGGSAKSKGPGILIRKQEIETLSKEVLTLDKNAKDIQIEFAETENQLAQTRSKHQQAEKELSENRITETELKREISFINQEIVRLKQAIDITNLEKDEAHILLEDEKQIASNLETSLASAGQENLDIDQKVADIQKEIEALEKSRVQAREKLMQLKVDLAGSSEKSAGLQNIIDQSGAALIELESSLISHQNNLVTGNETLHNLHQEQSALKKESDIQTELHISAQKNYKNLLEERNKLSSEITALDAQIKETSNSRVLLVQSMHDGDVKEARLEVQLSQASERIMEEYEISYLQAVSWPEAELEIERGAAGEVARLRREIKLMGQINTGAVSEYERIKERWDFLTEQKTDLESASDQIKDAIKDIDGSTRGLFMETYNKVAVHFDEIFKQLFNGGKTELSLTLPNNLLETGIDINVQPPGKKMQDLGLLSGGERALTATALLFSLLRAKPSPFVVMDEVDAPLDESNVERFADVLQEFAKKSQFIVITHNRATMEAAGYLYGVTMEEPGVSKVISVKLSGETSELVSASNGVLTAI